MHVITGNEKQTADPRLNAVIDFYRAFNSGDLALMQRNWAADPDILMANPLGGMKRGWDEIGAVYDRIFNGPAKVYVEFYDFILRPGGEMFTVIGRELGSFKIAEVAIDLAIRTSRVFQHINGNWRQVHHHGSMDSPELLRQYQAAVLKPNP